MKNFLEYIQRAWYHLGSLKITVVLLGLATVLVFIATLDQVNYGVRHAQERYFESWLTPLPFVMPGGYLLGALSLINLLAAHPRYFKKFQFGIACIHIGVGLLLVSAIIAGSSHREGQLWISEGHSANVIEVTTQNELVAIERLGDGQTRTYSLSEEKIHPSSEVKGYPFRVKILKLLANANIGPREKNLRLIADSDALILDSLGRTLTHRREIQNPAGYLRDSDWVIFEAPPTYREGSVNALTALVSVGEEGHTYLLSNLLGESFLPQTYTHQGVTYELSLRLKRETLPFKLHLEDFRFDRYEGSDIAKNFSSEVTVQDGNATRKALISMNHPLRYGGYTFYQASFDQATEGATMLLVVQNPSVALPYIAVSLLTLGLVWHLFKRFFAKGKHA